MPAGKAANGLYSVDVTPRTGGWDFSSLRVLDLPPGGWQDFDTEDSEWITLPLSGSCTVATGGQTFRLVGRESVFTGVTDFLYTPRDAHVSLATRGGGRFALTGARCDRRLPARYQPASAVPSNCAAAASTADRSTTSPLQGPWSATSSSPLKS